MHRAAELCTQLLTSLAQILSQSYHRKIIASIQEPVPLTVSSFMIGMVVLPGT